jgi:hypothetical protein
MKRFLQTPTEDAYIDTTLAMRKDLYNIKTRLKINDLKIN